MNNLVFVYGSLKSGGMVRGLDGFPGATIVGKATTRYPDYNMLDLGSFPGVTKKGDKHIQGEVWEVDDTTMEELDMIKDHPIKDHTIVIDDIPIYFSGREDQLMDKIRGINPDYQFTYYKSINPVDDYILVAYV